MYRGSFEGDFKTRPQQSLGGASKKEERDNLLARTQANRKKREDQRHRILSAIQIQSCYRSSVIRRSQKVIQRQLFDSEVRTINQSLDGATLHQLKRRLHFFYSPGDGQRLTTLCQLVIKHKELFLGHQSQDAIVHKVRSLLSLCSRYMQEFSSGSESIAIPLRMIEVYTNTETYCGHIESYITIQDVLRQIFMFLVQNGYYKHMKAVLHSKVPTSIERSSVPPTPIAETIYSLIMRPTTSVINCHNDTYMNVILQSLCNEFLCEAHTEQISDFILPCMARGSIQFPFADMLAAICDSLSDIKYSVQYEETMGKCRQHPSHVKVTTELLFAVLYIGEQFLDSLSFDDIQRYLYVLKCLVPTLAVTSNHWLHVNQEDSSDDEAMDTQTMISNDLREDCVRLLEQPQQITCFLLASSNEFSTETLVSVCTICHTLMSELKRSVHKTRLLYSLTFNPSFIRRLWYTCVTLSTKNLMGSETSLLQILSTGLPMSDTDAKRIIPLLSVFCNLFNHSVMTIHDAEFYSIDSQVPSSMPLTLSELVPLTLSLREACLGIIELVYPDSKPNLGDYRIALKNIGVKRRTETSNEEKKLKWAYLFKVMVQLIRQLYSRDTRRPFCPYRHWLSSHAKIYASKQMEIFKPNRFVRRPFGEESTYQADAEDGPPLSTHELRCLTILTELPFVVSFSERVKILQRLITQDKKENFNDIHNFLHGPSIQISIRRNYIYEDAFEKLSFDNEPNLKLRMQVQLRNIAGLDEPGIDGGGLFREFLSELLKTCFDANRGFFQYTTDKLIYPNTQAQYLVENFTNHYYFIGRMLGKAIYENMLVELPFASFFLSKILSRSSGDVDIHHMDSLDPELYKNLLFLKTYDGDVRDLGLDFTVVNNELGATRVEELKPGGSNIQVTNSNKIEYIHLVADYKLNKQIRTHSNAFRSGLADVINLEWLRMFDYNELQVIISGAQVPINLDDLKKHTNYSGGYTADHWLIQSFWKVVESFNDSEKRQLLKFVTSCSRPPLLGFKDLYPPFCVHYGGKEEDRLPTASTCMNFLKLPEFHTEELLRSKLLYAIESGAGFELS